jgi:hypothetical protein
MPAKPEETWFQKAAEKIAREGKTLYAACLELEIPITSREAENVFRTKAFQRVLWAERQRFAKELANEPERNKSSLVGQMLFAAQQLLNEGKFDKAAEVLFKLARIEGYVGNETQVTVIGQLTQTEIDAAKERLKTLASEAN